MKRNLIVLASAVLILGLISCEDLTKDKTSAEIAQGIEGHWKCEETSSIFKSTTGTYWVDIVLSSSDSTTVYISNFYKLGETIQAIAKIDNYEISLINQTLDGGFSISGSGTISSNLETIIWDYIVDDGSGEKDEVSATYTLSY